MDNSVNIAAERNAREAAAAEQARYGTGAHDAARGAREPNSIGSLISELWRETTTLAQQQAELAKAEASEKVNQIALGVGSIAAAGAVVFAGFIILLMSAVNALAPHLPPQYAAWLAPLIVGLVIIVIGFIMFSAGKKALEASSLKPSRTVESMRRNTQMVKEHVQ